MRLISLCLLLLAVSLPASAARTILVLGDSLSAGYGIPAKLAWPSLLQQRLTERGLDYNVVNLSISGETSAGGRARLPAALRTHRPAIVILALGANDGLRGLPIEQLRSNLDAMLEASGKSGARTLLAGMRLPPNYGPYAERFFESFGLAARKHRVALLPFLLEPVALQPRLFLADQLHPSAEAQPRILEHVWIPLEPLIH